MSNMTPFQLRLELLKMAQNMLEQDYFAKREKTSSEYAIKCEIAKLSGQSVPEHPGFDLYPTEADIISKAQALNSFVSQFPQDNKTSKKST